MVIGWRDRYLQGGIGALDDEPLTPRDTSCVMAGFA